MLDAAKTLKLSIEVIQLAVYFFDRFVDHAERLFLGDRLEVQVLACLQLAGELSHFRSDIAGCLDPSVIVRDDHSKGDLMFKRDDSFVPAKSIEWDQIIPRGSDLNGLLNYPFKLSEYVEAERKMLLFFQWNVGVPVMSTFLGYFR